MTALVERLTALHAGRELAAWAGTQPDLATAWRECKRGDWMLWLAGVAEIDRRLLVAAACDCAETALDHVREEDLIAVLLALHVAREFVAGRADKEDASHAAYAASSAASAALVRKRIPAEVICAAVGVA